MDDFTLKRLSVPVITGTPMVGGGQARTAAKQAEGPSFGEVLRQQLTRSGGEVPVFSKHAAQRAADRGIELTGSQLQRLGQGVRMAKDKGLDDALILVDRNAFIVSAKNNTVITAVEPQSIGGSVFTNIEGTVII